MRPAFRVDRRSFLQLLGSSGALATLSSLRTPPAAAAEPGPGGFFADAELEILAAALERIVASDDPALPALRETRALETVDALCAGLDPATTAPLPALLRLVEWGPWIFELRPQRFTQLAPAARDASLRGWMQSRFALRRQGFAALRNLGFLGYYAQPETWDAIGYAGPLLARGESPA